MVHRPEEIVRALNDHRDAFKAFLVARVGNEADAEDLLQHGLIKALKNADELRDGEKSIAWFYRILRHAIIDHGRSRNAARRRDLQWIEDAATLVDDAEAERTLCGCFEGLLPSLKSAHTELLRRVDLQNQPVSTAANALRMTANNASVTLLRARAALRKNFREFCDSCADDACLDCGCGEKNRNPCR